ncbi:MAG: hypothetical protein KAR35_11065, partial [Candidatus Heimdallarchaeota archaeon]|nr:hypothetical protein [Candidatus Heimdallarchaeota archaeon]MCK5049900.1 hypothetical protein [Candidatus Heimdallarchaeota archaeon]
VEITLTGHGRSPIQSGRSLKGFVTFDEIRWWDAGEYELIFTITGTGFGVVELSETVTIKQREFMDDISFYFNYFSNEFGIYATMIGGFLGIIGFFRGSIARMFGRARKCSFCGSLTSSKYNFCSACGNEVGTAKASKKPVPEETRKNVPKLD